MTKIYSVRPGQVVKLSTSGRLAALLRAACHHGWCVCGQLVWGMVVRLWVCVRVLWLCVHIRGWGGDVLSASEQEMMETLNIDTLAKGNGQELWGVNISWLDIECMRRAVPRSWARYTACALWAAPRSWSKYIISYILAACRYLYLWNTYNACEYYLQ